MPRLTHTLWGTALMLICIVLAGCGSPRSRHDAASGLTHYASLLQIEEADSFTLVTVADAWHSGRVMASYVLVPAAHPLPVHLPQGTVVRTPLRRAAVTSSVHAALLTDLGRGSCVAALTDTAYIISPAVKALLHEGTRSAGTAMQPDIELLHALSIDAVLASPFENAGHGALDRLGVPVIECADYMETSPLGRAEWMRFYGRLFGCADRADSLFDEVEHNYLELKKLVAEVPSATRPTVMCDLLMGSVWYQPGGASTMGQFIADAGGRYLWADRKESGSLALNLESVFARAQQAEVWLVKYGQPAPLTYRQMAADCPAYQRFAPWQRHRIYACNTLHVPFYEEVPFRPERLLANLIALLHPEVKGLPVHPNYYTPLGE